jgi:hypothetical protein
VKPGVGLIQGLEKRMGHVQPWVLRWCGALFVVMTVWVGAAMAADSAGSAYNGDGGTVRQPPPAGKQAFYQKLSEHLEATLALSAGLRFDQLDWSIAGNAAGTNPNIRSELEWSDVFSHQVALGGRARVGRHFYARAHVGYAAIQSGTVRDSDYDGDGRSLEFSRSVSDTNDDHLWDVVAGAGYPFTFQQGRLILAPLLGISIHKQNFRITNGWQVISEEPLRSGPPPPVGPLDSRLNSTYQALWWGPWIGCDVRYRMAAPDDQAPPMEWGLGLAYHFWTDFSAEATWNLREDLNQPKSFDQEADGHGLSIHAEWLIRVTRHLNASLLANYTRWSTDPGSDTFYFADGRVYSTRLNRVEWQSHSVMIGIAYHFF